MAKFTLEDIIYGDKYGIGSTVLSKIFKMPKARIGGLEPLKSA